jgi:CHAT domain-containing protein
MAKWIPLVREHELVNLPSASVLAVLRAEQMRRPLAPRSVAVFADPVFSEDDPRLRGVAKTRVAQSTDLHISQLRGLDDGDEQPPITRLPFTRREANAIREIAPNDSFQALDFLASRASATDPALSGYQIIHFATHGFIDGDHPHLSGLILSLFNEQGQAEDGFLRLQDIYNLRLNAQLVILSACQSGLGKLSKAEGLIGLTRGFMYAGASRVMSSLWRVDDAATAELMQRVYQGIFTEHLSPAAALRRAQLALWSDPHWTFPFYWAPFVISGEWSG